MKIRQHCRNPECLAKNSMISIVTKEYYSKKRMIEGSFGEKEKTYRTHKKKVAFYICKKCTWMSDFKLNDIRSSGIFSIALVPKTDILKIKEVKSKKKISCIYCEEYVYPANPQKEGIKTTSVIRLFVGPTDEFLGYFCKVCRLAYGIPLTIIKWKNTIESYKSETINVLNSLNSAYSESVRQKDPRYDKERKILVNYVDFIKIGYYSPTLDIEDYPSNPPEYLGVMVPQNKMKNLKKWLEKHNCEIVR